MANKNGLVLSSVALILLVACALGIIAAMHFKSVQQEEQEEDDETTTSVKAVTVVCQPTQYKDACQRTLAPLANHSKATPKDYLLASIRSAKLEVHKVLQAAANSSDNIPPQDRARIHECTKLLSFAIQDLESTVITMETKNRTLGDHIKDLRNRLTAVYSFQSQCKATINKSGHKYKSLILEFMLNSTQLSDNALAIASGFSEIIKELNIDQFAFSLDDLNLQYSRRLLQSQDGTTSLPTLLPARDSRRPGSAPAPAPGPGPEAKPDIVVAKDGSGRFMTIGEAVATYKTPLPPGKQRYIIYVKAGEYNEQVVIQRHQENVYIFGDGDGTIVTCDKSAVKHKLETPYTATFDRFIAAEGKGFMAKSMTFRNTAGPEGEQAVALRVQSEGAVIYLCKIEGYLDTLLCQNYRQFYRECVITGTIDFIFGEGSAVIQKSEIVVRKPKASQNNLVIVADGNEKPYQIGGLVLHNCTVRLDKDMEMEVDKGKYNIYLGRPWMPSSTSAIMESDLGGFLKPEGYVPWPQAQNEKTCRFFEYNNRGAGATSNNRVKWITLNILTDPAQAQPYTVATFIDGKQWLQQQQKNIGAPFYLGFIHS
ncbi:pectinesterase-like [Cynara cardunculus var. scolymus]|uniref:Pectinesterase n=1 Tax=Cynara cardunculus var. scolymus TaxID=59895 RepID=A0A103YNS0_CYNCS|nr:pectinesterase-like [Cynara cardunculus var. scolymus]KVI12477.1 Pectinesterase, active site-containing protein [Cynara cardunculus var. scolymus]